MTSTKVTLPLCVCVHNWHLCSQVHRWQSHVVTPSDEPNYITPLGRTTDNTIEMWSLKAVQWELVTACFFVRSSYPTPLLSPVKGTGASTCTVRAQGFSWHCSALHYSLSFHLLCVQGLSRTVQVCCSLMLSSLCFQPVWVQFHSFDSNVPSLPVPCVSNIPFIVYVA